MNELHERRQIAASQELSNWSIQSWYYESGKQEHTACDVNNKITESKVNH